MRRIILIQTPKVPAKPVNEVEKNGENNAKGKPDKPDIIPLEKKSDVPAHNEQTIPKVENDVANPGHNPGETGNGADVPKPANDDNKNTPENNEQDNPVDPVQTPDVPARNEETVAKVENDACEPWTQPG